MHAAAQAVSCLNQGLGIHIPVQCVHASCVRMPAVQGSLGWFMLADAKGTSIRGLRAAHALGRGCATAHVLHIGLVV